VSTSEPTSAKPLVLGFFLVLFLAHQDFWLWDDGTLVMGFMPIGLAYHALFSVACSCLWALACFKAWPEQLEQWANKETALEDKPEGEEAL
jgi:hypothetical protein